MLGRFGCDIDAMHPKKPVLGGRTVRVNVAHLRDSEFSRVKYIAATQLRTLADIGQNCLDSLSLSRLSRKVSSLTQNVFHPHKYYRVEGGAELEVVGGREGKYKSLSDKRANQTLISDADPISYEHPIVVKKVLPKRLIKAGKWLSRVNRF